MNACIVPVACVTASVLEHVISWHLVPCNCRFCVIIKEKEYIMDEIRVCPRL